MRIFPACLNRCFMISAERTWRNTYARSLLFLPQERIRFSVYDRQLALPLQGFLLEQELVYANSRRRCISVKFNPFIWGVMTQRMKPGLKKVWNGDVKTLIIDARPIYRELLSKVEGISDGNPMASNTATKRSIPYSARQTIRP